jgi:hypothetical protein
MTFRTILSTPHARRRAHELIIQAPDGWVAELREPRRTLDQNDLLWSLLTDISRAEPMGRKHTPDDWKAIAMNAAGWECQFIEGLDGRPFPQGFRSSQMTKSQMSVLIEWLLAFMAEQGIEPTHTGREA